MKQLDVLATLLTLALAHGDSWRRCHFTEPFNSIDAILDIDLPRPFLCKQTCDTQSSSRVLRERVKWWKRARFRGAERETYMTDQVSNVSREGLLAVRYYLKFVCTVFRWSSLQGYTAAQSSQDLVSGDELQSMMNLAFGTNLSDTPRSTQKHEDELSFSI